MNRTLIKSDEFEPEENLILSVIASGIYENDTAYFAGPAFEMHCYLLGLKPEVAVRMAKQLLNEQNDEGN